MDIKMKFGLIKDCNKLVYEIGFWLTQSMTKNYLKGFAILSREIMLVLILCTIFQIPKIFF